MRYGLQVCGCLCAGNVLLEAITADDRSVLAGCALTPIPLVPSPRRSGRGALGRFVTVPSQGEFPISAVSPGVSQGNQRDSGSGTLWNWEGGRAARLSGVWIRLEPPATGMIEQGASGRASTAVPVTTVAIDNLGDSGYKNGAFQNRGWPRRPPAMPGLQTGDRPGQQLGQFARVSWVTVTLPLRGGRVDGPARSRPFASRYLH